MIMEILSDGVTVCMTVFLAVALFAVLKYGELCGGNIFLRWMGGIIIRKGQRVNIHWMHLITYMRNVTRKHILETGWQPIFHNRHFVGDKQNKAVLTPSCQFLPWMEELPVGGERWCWAGKAPSKEAKSHAEGQPWTNEQRRKVVRVQAVCGPGRSAPRAWKLQLWYKTHRW